MSNENQSGNLTDFAEVILSLTKQERIMLLNKHYEKKEPKLKDILTGPNLPERPEPEKSKKSPGKSYEIMGYDSMD